MNDGPSWVKHQSITEQKNLDEFLATAELAGTEFTAERTNAFVVSNDYRKNYEISREEQKQLKETFEKNFDKLRIPRKPKWTKEMTADQIERNENNSFLEWRKSLAILQEDENLVLTPFEKNIEVWRQLWRVVEKSQIIAQIVDARNPLLFYCQDLIFYARQVDPEKKNILIVNKADLLTEEQRKVWANYFNENNISFVFYSAALANAEEEDDSDENDSKEMKEKSTGKGETDIRSRDEILEIFENEGKVFRKELPSITIGLVGYPNVGKSSTINSLINAKKVAVGATPGKTKHFQTLWLDKETCLCDCPGLVFPNFAFTKAELVVNGILPIDQMRECYGPAKLVAERIPRNILEKIYGIQIALPAEDEDPNRAPTAAELLSAYAIMRGYMRSGQGNPDESRAARYILKDFVNGKLLFCYPPPNIDEKEFNANNNFIIKEKNLRTDFKGIKCNAFDDEFFEDKSVVAKVSGKQTGGEFVRVIHPFQAQSGQAAKSSKKHFNKDRRK